MAWGHERKMRAQKWPQGRGACTAGGCCSSRPLETYREKQGALSPSRDSREWRALWEVLRERKVPEVWDATGCADASPHHDHHPLAGSGLNQLSDVLQEKLLLTVASTSSVT